MQHESCEHAIHTLRKETAHTGGASNVHTIPQNCQCRHVPTPCNWVGNPMQYACLPREFKAPQNVYTHSHVGGIGKIETNWSGPPPS